MDKFLFIKESDDSGTLLAQDGGVAIIWFNEEHMVAQCYRERLEAEQIKIGYEHAYQYMAGRSSNSALMDYEEDDDIKDEHLEEMADWLVMPREGEFLENLIRIDATTLSKKELDKTVQEFLKGVTE